MKLSYDQCHETAARLVSNLRDVYEFPIKIWGVPRGGVYAALLLTIQTRDVVIVDQPNQAHLAVDDIIGSGNTVSVIKKLYGLDTVALYSRLPRFISGVNIPPSTEFLLFPWEQKFQKPEEYDSDEEVVVRMLEAIGEDPRRLRTDLSIQGILIAWKTWVGKAGLLKKG